MIKRDSIYKISYCKGGEEVFGVSGGDGVAHTRSGHRLGTKVRGRSCTEVTYLGQAFTRLESEIRELVERMVGDGVAIFHKILDSCYNRIPQKRRVLGRNSVNNWKSEAVYSV
ncbi:hypothetical protein CHISP_2324 [Chitinispirillum alkaliphilum]|nr:hypothetical protein CHISP_2324 [Chitinispirillum alkaliphilum]